TSEVTVPVNVFAIYFSPSLLDASIARVVLIRAISLRVALITPVFLSSPAARPFLYPRRSACLATSCSCRFFGDCSLATAVSFFVVLAILIDLPNDKLCLYWQLVAR